MILENPTMKTITIYTCDECGCTYNAPYCFCARGGREVTFSTHQSTNTAQYKFFPHRFKRVWCWLVGHYQVVELDLPQGVEECRRCKVALFDYKFYGLSLPKRWIIWRVRFALWRKGITL